MLKMNPPSQQRLSDIATINQPGLRAIVFEIDNYRFALPIDAVLKIVPCPPLSSPIQDGIGIADWEAQTITVIDLYQKFFQPTAQNSQKSPYNNRFLILTMTQDREICGFAIDRSPTLMDIPLNDIRSVPLSYRQVAELGFVSHMAILSNERTEQPLKIFLLGYIPQLSST